MIDKKPSDILSEYLYLNKPTFNFSKSKLIDHLLSPLYLFREYSDTSIFYFLNSSQTIKIDNKYLKLFRDLDVLYGEQILYTEIKGLKGSDLFIIGFLKFIKMIDSKNYQGSSELLLTLCRLGTIDIRRLFNLYGISLNPWIFESQEKTLEL